MYGYVVVPQPWREPHFACTFQRGMPTLVHANPQTKELRRHMATTTRFATTLKALQNYKEMAPEAAIKNIEGWEEYLKNHDAPGVKSIVSDLGKLKELLGAEKLDGSKIRALVVKLGKETLAVAKEGGANSGHIEELGTALNKAA